MKRICPAVMLLFVGVWCLSLVGCAEKLTRPNWDMVTVGMYDKSDVKVAIGKPQKEPSNDLWWYFKDGRNAKIYFDAKGKVKAKKWWLDDAPGKMATVPEGWIDK